MSRGTNMYHVLHTCKKWHHVNAMTFVLRACFFVHVHKKFAYSCTNCAFPIFNNLKKEWSISVTYVRLWKKQKKRFECDIYELTAWCLCIIHFFLVHEISPLHTCKKRHHVNDISTRWKNLLHTCKTVCRLLLFMSRYNNKFSELTW